MRIRLTEAGVRVRRANSVLDPALVAEMLEQLPTDDLDPRRLMTLSRRRSMRWFLIAVAAGAAIVLLVVVTGLLLPRAHTARSYATINAPPDSVWRALTEVEAFPAWRGDVARVEILAASNGHKTWREIGKNGAITFEEVAAEPPRRLVAKIADPTLPFGGSWTYGVAAEGSGSRVTITEDGVVHNPVFRFMSRFVFGHHATQEAFLRALGRKFGHDVTPVRG